METESREDRPEDRPPEHGLPEGVGDQIEEHVRRTRLAGLFLQSPSFMAVTRGEEHVFVNANPAYRGMVGDRELIGRSAGEAFPELERQGFIDLLDRVYETGEPYVGSEEATRLRMPGTEGEDGLRTVWVSYSYHPLRDAEGNVSGILHHGIDVTERVALRKDLKRRVRQEAAVAELGRTILGSERLSEAVGEIVSTATKVLDADAVALYRFRDEDTLAPEGPEALAGTNDPPRPLRVDGDHVPGQAFRRGVPVLRRHPERSSRQPVFLCRDAAVEVAVPVPGGGGRPLGVLWVEARDAGAFGEDDIPALESVARIAGAATRRQEDRRFRETVARNLPGLLYRCRNDRAWTMEFLSEGTERLTGYRPEELTGETGPTFADLIHPGDRDAVWEEVQAAVREEEPFHLQYRIQTKGGQEKWVWEQGRAVEPATGGSSLLEGYIFDVTEKREAEREADWLDSVLQAAFRGTREALFVVQLPERTIVECNPGAEELFGYSREEMLGQSTEILHVDSEHQEEFGRRSEELLRSQGFYHGEFEMRRKDGSVFPTDHSVTFVDGAQDPPGYAVSIIRDISERKERKARLERSRRLLQKYAAHLTEARERERAEIAREVHDELGQALTGLKFQLERLETALGDDPEAREAAARSREILGSVFDRVRDLSESLRPPHLDSLGLRRALAQLVEQWEDSTGLEGTFRFRGPDEGLGGDRDIHVYRVVQEALTNVARHADAARALVEVEARNGAWRVGVRDDGIGLSAGEADPPEGHGVLGMRERARLLEGELRVGEADGGGTEVVLEAPAEPGEHDD